ncbi:MAG: DUF1704 domain-containing protein, partial [Candidatus Woesebacteria bacterium]|nr:DUF1704 domain-containing protein [Candidatus Woesebacteria bacterium]
LKKRLERIGGIKVTSPEKGVRIAKDMFGLSTEKIKHHVPADKKIISKEEDIELILKNGISKLKANIDPSQERSTLDIKTAEKLKLLDSPDYNDEQSTLKIKFTLKNKRIQTVVDVEKIHDENFKVILGARDLKGFLIDPETTNKQKKVIQKPISRKKAKNHFEIDQEIANVDNKIKLLFHLRPVNLEEEKKKFLENFSYNPQFVYPELKFDSKILRQRLALIEEDEEPLDKIFAAKKEELIKKITLLEHVGEESFTEKSVNLFGKPDENIVEECEKLLLETKKFSFREKETINSSEAKNKFEEVFAAYGLKNWKVHIKEEMVTDCVAGKSNTLFVRKDAMFSEKKLQKLIVHEIETHILTAENGKHQPFEIFNRGLANYLITQEGLAIYNVTHQLENTIHGSFKAIALEIAVNEAMKGSFVNTFEKILSFGLPMENALRITLKVKRGLTDTSLSGAFTKDLTYFNGYKQVEKFVAEGGNLKDLYIGKFNLEDLALIKKIEGLVAPKYLPKWLK